MENWYILLLQPDCALTQEFLGRTTDVSIAIDHLDKLYLHDYQRVEYTPYVIVITDKLYQRVSDSNTLRKVIS